MPIFPAEVLQSLPPTSRAHVQALIEKHERAAAIARDVESRLFQARDHESDLRADFHRRTPVGSTALAIDAVRQDVEPKIAAVAEEITRLADASGRAKAELSRWGFLDGVARWAAGIVAAGGTFRACMIEAPKPKNGDYHAAVAAARDEIARLNAEYGSISTAPAPAADVKARIIAEVDRVASRGVPTINLKSRGSRPIGLDSLLRIEAANGGPVIGDAGAAFFVWLARDEIVARLHSMVDQADFATALTEDEREAALADIAAEKLDAERREEALITAATAAGQEIARRADADPRAILMLSDA